jgi:DNA invertase Pin-like site-specific DNA recombinase
LTATPVPRYILYARKSSESEDRQVLSIDSQIKELKDLARSQALEITAVLEESRSAKAPGREVFGRLLAEVARGRVQGILCWKLDRLARNPVDGGALIWAFDEGTLQQIVTPQRTFTNTGNDKFWMSLEFGIAKKYVDDLSDNVKRGIRAKHGQGWRTGLAPLGYLNDRATRTIGEDPVRFSLLRKLIDRILAGEPPLRMLFVLNNQWGFRTRQFRRIGGRPLTESGFYRLLSNPFYYGLIESGGGSWPGRHRPLLSKDEFDRIQEILGRPTRPQKERHRFAYTGLIRCGECGLAITAEEKTNRYGSQYTYYHCTKRNAAARCGQRTIRLEALEAQILDALRRIHIADDYRDWAMKHLRDVASEEASTRQAARQSVESAAQGVEKQLGALTDLRVRGFIDDADFATKRRELVESRLRLRERLANQHGTTPNWLEPATQAILFASEATNRFKRGNIDERRRILLTVGSNFSIRDKILRIQLQKPFALMDESARNGRHRGIVEQVRTFFQEHPKLIQWPSFCRAGQKESTTDTGSSIRIASSLR